MAHRTCAYVAVVGRPNAGKSTLLNALVGERLAIVSRRPQATRAPVVGLVTEGDCQLIFVDQPGLMEPAYLLHHAMREAAIQWIRRADQVLYLHPAGPDTPPPLTTLVPDLAPWPGHVATVRTMVDRYEAPLPPAPPADTFWVSARTGMGLGALVAWCRGHAPAREFVYDPDDLSAQPLRFFVTEFVREAAFEHLGDELPYSLVAEVDEYREGSDPLYIRVTLYVERTSQKRMVIGQGGRMIKTLGETARRRIEELLGQRVYLDLWAKTLPKWRSNPQALARFGFELAGGSR